MLVALDLTARQTARVLTQAVRTHAKLEIEPRPEHQHVLLWGCVESQDRDTLLVELHDPPAAVSLALLPGSMCDVRTILSGQLCMFSTYVVEVSENTVPRRLRLAVPETIRVANRRRFARHTPQEPLPVRIHLPGNSTPFVAILSNIGPQGLASRIVSQELGESLFIGDEVQLDFSLPWSAELYTLPAAVCSKTVCGDEGHFIVGFNFLHRANDHLLGQLRAALHDEAARLVETDGEP